MIKNNIACMARHYPSEEGTLPVNSTVVAVEKDNKNSKAAVRWAIDNLLVGNPFIILIHVRHKTHHRSEHE